MTLAVRLGAAIPWMPNAKVFNIARDELIKPSRKLKQ
jgi:hypothetical protein